MNYGFYALGAGLGIVSDVWHCHILDTAKVSMSSVSRWDCELAATWIKSTYADQCFYALGVGLGCHKILDQQLRSISPGDRVIACTRIAQAEAFAGIAEQGISAATMRDLQAALTPR